MKIGTTALLLATLTGCAAVPEGGEGGFRIRDFQHGLISMGPDGPERVSEPGGEFRYTVNGSCIVSRERRPCMWHGFSFSYTSATPITVLDCKASFESPTLLATPRMAASEPVMEGTWRLRLEGYQGHKIHPQYAAPEPGRAAGRRSTRIACRHEGREVFSYEMTVIYGDT